MSNIKNASYTLMHHPVICDHTMLSINLPTNMHFTFDA